MKSSGRELSVKNSLEVDSLMHIMLLQKRELGTEKS